MAASISQQFDLIADDPRCEARPSSLSQIRDYIRSSLEQGGLVTQGQAARLLGVNTGQVNTWMKRGRLSTFDAAGLNMVSAAELAALLRERESGCVHQVGRGNKAPALSDMVRDIIGEPV